MKTLALDEFRALMKAQNVPMAKVTFQCPQCKTLQCAEDLIEAGAGATLDDVSGYLGYSCVGRFTDQKGCNWTLGGLFQIHELEVINEKGEACPRFLPVKAEA